MTSQTVEHKPRLEREGYLRIVQVLLMMAFQGFILFTAAGRLDWWAAWAYLGMQLAGMAIFSAFIVRRNPEIINERGRKPKNTEPFDKIFGVIYIILYIALPLVAGLDERFGWSAVPAFWRWLGVLGMIPAIILPYWAMMVNAYLTTTVRIQKERGHQVVTSGPYRYVRHPMYVGLNFSSLAAPLFLGSWWALILGILTIIGVGWRTKREDETLQRALPGYQEYAQQVKYRLYPGIW